MRTFTALSHVQESSDLNVSGQHTQQHFHFVREGGNQALLIEGQNDTCGAILLASLACSMTSHLDESIMKGHLSVVSPPMHIFMNLPMADFPSIKFYNQNFQMPDTNQGNVFAPVLY